MSYVVEPGTFCILDMKGRSSDEICQLSGFKHGDVVIALSECLAQPLFVEDTDTGPQRIYKTGVVKISNAHWGHWGCCPYWLLREEAIAEIPRKLERRRELKRSIWDFCRKTFETLVRKGIFYEEENDRGIIKRAIRNVFTESNGEEYPSVYDEYGR